MRKRTSAHSLPCGKDAAQRFIDRDWVGADKSGARRGLARHPRSDPRRSTVVTWKTIQEVAWLLSPFPPPYQLDLTSGVVSTGQVSTPHVTVTYTLWYHSLLILRVTITPSSQARCMYRWQRSDWAGLPQRCHCYKDRPEALNQPPAGLSRCDHWCRKQHPTRCREDSNPRFSTSPIVADRLDRWTLFLPVKSRSCSPASRRLLHLLPGFRIKHHLPFE